MDDCTRLQVRLKELLHYDPDTGVFTNIKARKGIRVGDVSGTTDRHGYKVIYIDRRQYKAHRLAWLYVNGEFPPEQIDHINRDREDNRICNLRCATRTENNQNLSVSSRNTSGHIGVSWCARLQKWHARIMANRKYIHIGYFNEIVDAIAARESAKRQYHTF